MKLCKNCKYYTKLSTDISIFEILVKHLCSHPDVVIEQKSPITGEYDVSSLDSCYFSRSETGPCGYNGKLYEPKVLRKFLIKLKVVDE